LRQLSIMKKTAYLALFSCLILFQSCFEIIEEVFLKNDGSGNFQLTLNLSKSKTKLNSIIKMKTINGHDVPSKDDIKNRVSEIEKTVAKTAGITNVKTSMDFDNYIISMSCNFNKVTHLNNIVKNISNKDNKNKRWQEKSFEYDATTNTFERLNKISLKNDYNKMSNADKEVFATANYTAIYKFENSAIAVSNKETKIAGSKKAVMLKLNVLDIITNKKSIENKINLTKQ
jgi:hypothetical protein